MLLPMEDPLPAWNPKQAVSFLRTGALAYSPVPLSAPPRPQCQHRSRHTAGMGHISTESMGISSSLNSDEAQALRQLGSQAGSSPGCRSLGRRHHSLSLNENVTVLGVQHTLADELLGDGNGNVVGYTQVGEVVQEPGVVNSRGGGRHSETGPRGQSPPSPSPSWQHRLPGPVTAPAPSSKFGDRLTRTANGWGVRLVEGSGSQDKGGTRTEVILKNLTTDSMQAPTLSLEKGRRASCCTRHQPSYC